MKSLYVIVPNWNGADFLSACIDSLLSQTYPHMTIIVVENGSSDESNTILASYKDRIVVLKQQKNLGFAGGVNVGIQYALDHDADYVALFNNDARADTYWAEKLVGFIDTRNDVGIVTSRFLNNDGSKIDSTGDFYTVWGLPYPRGRDTASASQYLESSEVFGASGGASIYRANTLRQIGLFDEDFFAYFEDVDISFRAQLYGWKIYYCADAIAYHLIGGTSKKIKGFGVYQTFKNFPFVFLKNMPFRLFWRHLPKVTLVYFGLLFGAIKKGHGIPAIKGFLTASTLIPTMLFKRWRIQRHKTSSSAYIESIIEKDPPANQIGIWRLKKMLRV